jgi:hypothetical protein
MKNTKVCQPQGQVPTRHSTFQDIFSEVNPGKENELQDLVNGTD